MTKVFSLITNGGQGNEDIDRRRLNHKPCRLETGRRQFYDSLNTL